MNRQNVDSTPLYTTTACMDIIMRSRQMTSQSSITSIVMLSHFLNIVPICLTVCIAVPEKYFTVLQMLVFNIGLELIRM